MCGVRMKLGRRTSSKGCPFFGGSDRQYIETGTCDQPLFERLDERRLIDQPAAGGIDEQGAALHFSKGGEIDEVARGRGERAVQGNDVGFAEHLLMRQ